MDGATLEVKQGAIGRKVYGVLAVLTFILIGLGSFVRATGAGLACPDWPLCFGKAAPALSYGVAQEVIHRYVAGLALLLTLYCVYAASGSRRENPKAFRFSLILLGILVVQAVFGGLTVLLKLNPWIVVTHLALGTAFLQLVAAAATDRGYAAQAPSPGMRRASKVVLAVLHVAALQLLVGGFVAASGASLACLDFPLCNGSILPEGASAAHVVQMTHRLLAFVLLGLMVFYALKRRSFGWEAFPVEARRFLANTLWLTLAQFVVGVGNIHMKISPVMSVVHLLIAQLILLMFLLAHRSLKGWSLTAPRAV